MIAICSFRKVLVTPKYISLQYLYASIYIGKARKGLALSVLPLSVLILFFFHFRCLYTSVFKVYTGDFQKLQAAAGFIRVQ